MREQGIRLIAIGWLVGRGRRFDGEMSEQSYVF